jgi:hypothetical protein
MKLPDALFQDVTGLSAPAGGDPVDDDRRAAQRVFLGQRTTVLRDRTGVSDDAADAMIGRVSVTGLGVVCERAIAVGEVFTVLLPRRQGESVPVRCAAVTCHPCAGGSAYLVGAVYRAVLSDEYAPSTGVGQETGTRQV